MLSVDTTKECQPLFVFLSSRTTHWKRRFAISVFAHLLNNVVIVLPVISSFTVDSLVHTCFSVHICTFCSSGVRDVFILVFSFFSLHLALPPAPKMQVDCFILCFSQENMVRFNDSFANNKVIQMVGFSEFLTSDEESPAVCRILLFHMFDIITIQCVGYIYMAK